MSHILFLILISDSLFLNIKAKSLENGFKGHFIKLRVAPSVIFLKNCFENIPQKVNKPSEIEPYLRHCRTEGDSKNKRVVFEIMETIVLILFLFRNVFAYLYSFGHQSEKSNKKMSFGNSETSHLCTSVV